MSDKNSTPGADPSPPSGASAATGDKVSKAAPAAAEDKVSKAAPATPGAPGLPDLQAHVEAPTWLSGGEEHDAQIWSGAFDIEAGSQGGGDADVVPAEDEGKEAAESGLPAEPEVTNPDDVTLENPVLATPEVGSEAAEAASLDETAAEVKAVEAEAADAAVLTDPAANRPDKDRADKDIPAADDTEQDAGTKQADHAEQVAETEPVAESEQASPEARGAKAVDHTQGIAAAAPMTGEHPSAGSDLEEKSAAPESTGESPALEAPGSTAPAPEASGSTAPAPGSRRALRTAETPIVDGNGKGGSKRLLLIIGGIAAVVVLAVVLFLVLGNSEKEPGVLEEDVAPIELETGACLSGFAGVNEPTTVVTCETPHNAQLVATATYPEDDAFPGADALSQRANEVCSSVRYTEAATQNADLGLQVSKAVPTPESWNDGDRRVDCFVVADEGQELTESLIEQ